jgi:hypothetical protein
MLKPNSEKLMRRLALLAVLLILVVSIHAPSATVSQTQAQTQAQIKDGIGLGEILIGVSSAADVEARYGKKYDLINKNGYSFRMDYADLGLAFYYCLKDEKKRVFLVELHQGVSSKGITVGQSTLRDVFRLYGEVSGGEQTDVHEYKGIQFYIEPDPTAGARNSAARLDKKVVEIDIVSPDQSSNFCD